MTQIQINPQHTSHLKIRASTNIEHVLEFLKQIRHNPQKLIQIIPNTATFSLRISSITLITQRSFIKRRIFVLLTSERHAGFFKYKEAKDLIFEFH